MTVTTRAAFLRDLADRVPVLGRPVLVTVDGVDGAGKSMLADELAELLRADGRPVVRASVDGFHHPRAFRHAEGRTGEAFWSRSFDYPAVVLELLGPWRRGAGASYRTAVHDVRRDEVLDLERQPGAIPAGARTWWSTTVTWRDRGSSELSAPPFENRESAQDSGID